MVHNINRLHVNLCNISSKKLFVFVMIQSLQPYHPPFACILYNVIIHRQTCFYNHLNSVIKHLFNFIHIITDYTFSFYMWISLFLFHFCLNFNAKLVDHELSLGQYTITIDNFTSGSSLHVHVFVISQMQLCYMIRIQIFLNLTRAANNFFLVKVLLMHHLSRANKLQSEIIKNIRFTQGRFLFILP